MLRMSLRVNESNASLYYMHIRITDCLFLVFMEGVLKRGLHLQPSDQWQGDLITVMLNLHRMMQIKPLPGLWETHLCFLCPHFSYGYHYVRICCLTAVETFQKGVEDEALTSANEFMPTLTFLKGEACHFFRCENTFFYHM